jgi:hypothetical protein
MSAGKEQNIPREGTDAFHYAIGPGRDLLRRFSAGTTIAEEFPSGAFREYVNGQTAFVLAVVPFDQIAIDLGGGSKASELTGPHGAL